MSKKSKERISALVVVVVVVVVVVARHLLVSFVCRCGRLRPPVLRLGLTLFYVFRCEYPHVNIHHSLLNLFFRLQVRTTQAAGVKVRVNPVLCVQMRVSACIYTPFLFDLVHRVQARMTQAAGVKVKVHPVFCVQMRVWG